MTDPGHGAAPGVETGGSRTEHTTEAPSVARHRGVRCRFPDCGLSDARSTPAGWFCAWHEPAGEDERRRLLRNARAVAQTAARKARREGTR